MQTKNMRLVAIMFFLLGAIAIGFMAARIALPWGAGLSGFTFFILGIAFSERRLVLGWAMSLFRTARLLRQQEDNLEQFVCSAVTDANLYPNELKDPDVPYITISLSWDNRSFRKVEIKDIRGVISIESHDPPDILPPNISDIDIKPWQKQDTPITIPVNITGEGLRIIQEIRSKGSGKANLAVSLKVQINGKPVTYDKILYKALYIG